ncbi:hypothetical protein F3P51_15060 [Bacteroides fragilis]|uniref:Uncharacterized protein n=1 Tax=Bacteroides fragilis TaxID=817 RepID=A0A642KKW2_BACFG|nr:hypothetical protein F2Z40_13005 [Bacteroides fragilis]KAA5086141.1 hypothetical protein F2Z82_16300 [Bacteroides fragilis]KAA5088035.1 hypothetical protein F2Z45_16260 [Bacteroides fragilis]KAA5098051.1 hypothetical protein F2Z46_16235 [Bacteroides fragilis]KAA5102059.1 hypothetical protein F2Z51_16100 [Bacteroides fragilis]
MSSCPCDCLAVLLSFVIVLLLLSLPTLLFKIPCPHTCFNRNYPFPSATYPFSQKSPPFFSISFIFNPFSPFVFPLSIT